MILLNVEPIYGDSCETAGYRCCDFCHETACEDIWAGHVHEGGWRLFYEVVGEGLVVCSCCLAGGLAPEGITP